MSGTPFRIAVQAGALAVMVHGYNSLGTLDIDKLMRQQYGGHLQYLTIQGLAMACLTMSTSLLYELFPTLTILRAMKRYLMVMAMPLSVVISSIYWSLIIFLPHLILPAATSPPAAPTSSAISPELFRIPLTLDLALHAVPCLSLVLDFFCFEQKYDHQHVKVGAPIAAFAFSLWYTLWVEYCAQKNHGIFPYPFLTENDLARRIGIYIGATFIAILSFRLINFLHR